MSPRERLLIAARLSMTVRKLAEAGVRLRYPDASTSEVSVRVAIRMYGRHVVERALGKLPEFASFFAKARFESERDDSLP